MNLRQHLQILACAALLSPIASGLSDLGNTVRVSVDSNKQQGNDDSGPAISHSIRVSADGRFVAFASGASNLVPGDTNGAQDVFLRDTLTGTTIRASIGTNGEQSLSNSYAPSISDDGRYVAFTCEGDELSPSDANGWRDIYLHDRQIGKTRLISMTATGAMTDASSENMVLSADGSMAAFWSAASNLVSGDTNGTGDIFVINLQTFAVQRVSLGPFNQQSNGNSFQADISADGNTVVFASMATNLVQGDTNGVWDIFIRDLTSATTTRVMTGTVQFNGNSDKPAVSGNGRMVAFESKATNIVAGDTNGVRDIFVHDTWVNTVDRVSVATSDVQANADSNQVRISRDGQWVCFSSWASNLVTEDTNGFQDVFLRQTTLDWTERISLRKKGKQGPGLSFYGDLGQDGRYIAFGSSSHNLVGGDTNGSRDVFVRDRELVGNEIGMTYCLSNNNSTGLVADLLAAGSPIVAQNTLTLLAADLPSSQFGILLMSDTQDLVPNFGGSQGNLCLGGSLVRFMDDLFVTPPSGSIALNPDLTNLPQSAVIAPGETWNFQVWFRDLNPGATSNTTNGVCVAFH